MKDRLSQSAPMAMTSDSFDSLPDVVLELRQGTARPATFPFSHVDFLIGTVPGCDLRIPGSDLPAVLCLLARRPGGLALRKLAPTQVVLVNGKSSSHADLHNGDRISIGATDIFVRLTPTAGAAPKPAPAIVEVAAQRDLQQQIAQLHEERDAFAAEQEQGWAELHRAQKLLEEREAKLRTQAAEVEQDRSIFLQRRQLDAAADITGPDLLQREEKLSLREAELQDQLADVQRQRQELANVRQELADIRKQLYDRYQERRDRLSGLQEAVDRAARKVQERKRLVDAEEDDLRQRSSDLDQLSTRLEDENRELDEERRSFQDFHDRARAEMSEKQADLQAREHRLAADRLELEGMVKHYQADVLRLDRQNEAAQERERKIKAREEELHRQHEHLQQSSAELEKQAAELDQWRIKLTHEADLFARQKVEQESQAEQLGLRETSLAAQQASLAALSNRLERQRDELQSQMEKLEEQRLRQEKNSADIEKETQQCAALQEKLAQRGRELAQQAAEFEQWQARLSAEDERQARIVAQHEARSEQLQLQESSLTAQQANLAAQAVELERRRGELQTLQEGLDQERARQERIVANIEKDAADIEKDFQKCAALKENLAQRGRELDQQAAEYEQWQRRLAAEDERQAQIIGQQETRAEQLQLQESSLTAQQANLTTLSNQLERRRAELQTVEEGLDQLRAHQERTAANIEKDQRALAEADDKLRLRGSELASLEHSLRDMSQRLQVDNAALKKAQEEMHRRRLDAEERDAVLAEQGRKQDQREARLNASEDEQRRLQEKLLDIEQNIADQRQHLAQERERYLAEQQRTRGENERMQTLFVEMRLQAESFVEQLPEIELRAGTTLERLAHAREQLRDHLSEISAYVRQCQEDTERDNHKIQEKERGLRQHQDEHRLALVSFRQQLIDWQAQVAETKRALGPADPAMPRGEVLRTPGMATTLSANAIPAEADVCSWYRRKFRDLAGVQPQPQSAGGPTVQVPTSQGEADDGDAPLIPIRRDILALTDPADPSDRQLADTLRRLKLIDADALQALQVEARRQRRPLRQVLLGAVTLHQLSLIETGNVDSLVLGPVYIVDRLRSSVHEVVHRVFDPRRGREAVLRLLTQDAVRSAGRADEFKKSFALALSTNELREHPHLVQTLEVLDVSGRPAVLQEFLAGLPSADWPPLISVPGVCFRVLIQAVQGLQAVHGAGLVHGHIHENLIVMMPDGIVKLGGLGEPLWLCEEKPAGQPVSAAGDLLSLGQVVSKWCTPLGIRRGAKTKPPPDALMSLVGKLAGEDQAGYRNATDLLRDLENIQSDIPANPEAWDRILRHIREHTTPTPLGAAS